MGRDSLSLDWALDKDYLVIHLVESGDAGQEWHIGSTYIPLKELKKKLEEVQ